MHSAWTSTSWPRTQPGQRPDHWEVGGTAPCRLIAINLLLTLDACGSSPSVSAAAWMGGRQPKSGYGRTYMPAIAVTETDEHLYWTDDGESVREARDLKTVLE